MSLAIDPQLRGALPHLPAFDLRDIPETRRLFLLQQQSAPAVDLTGVAYSRQLVPGPAGAPDVPVLVYRPTPATEPVPCVYDIHGGGFVFGSPEASHGRNVALCRDLQAVVVSVDYRLAPEDPFPAAPEDCYAVLLWIAEQAADLGVDGSRIAVHGHSAGGALSAVTAQLARDRGGPELCLQFLGIPILDDRLTAPSMQAFVDTPLWSRRHAELSWDSYLGAGIAGGPDVSPYAAPARATSFAGLAPAYISVMEFDPLRDEGIAYAQSLLAAGVPVELHLFPGAFHGSRILDRADISRAENEEELAVLRRAFRR